MVLTSEVFIVHLIWLCFVFLPGDAAPPKITVHSGETADLFYHKTSYESSEYFRGYRVQKDGVSFRYMKPGSNRSNCTENTTSKEFCVNRTEFTGVNASHLLLKIKETEVNDSGNYSLHSLFKLLHNDSLEEIILKVIKLKVHEKSTKPPPGDGHGSTESSDSSAITPPAATSRTVRGVPSILCLMFAVTVMKIQIL